MKIKHSKYVFWKMHPSKYVFLIFSVKWSMIKVIGIQETIQNFKNCDKKIEHLFTVWGESSREMKKKPNDLLKFGE
jgi:hypothetical protein